MSVQIRDMTRIHPLSKLVIRHSASDEGDSYAQRVRSYAELMGVDDEKRRRQIVDHNYDIAQQFLSYDRVEVELQTILNEPKLALTYEP